MLYDCFITTGECGTNHGCNTDFETTCGLALYSLADENTLILFLPMVSYSMNQEALNISSPIKCTYFPICTRTYVMYTGKPSIPELEQVTHTVY